MSFIFLPRAEVSPGPCPGLSCESSPSPSAGETDAGVVVFTSGSLSFDMSVLTYGNGHGRCVPFLEVHVDK